MQPGSTLRLAVSLALAPLLACSDGSSAPTIPDPVGAYTASEFTTTANGITTDELAEGVTLTLRLAEDGTTSGALNVPRASDEPVDLGGSWTRVGSTITFSHPLQTFIDKLAFTLDGNRLLAEGLVGPNFIHVTLTR